MLPSKATIMEATLEDLDEVEEQESGPQIKRHSTLSDLLKELIGGMTENFKRVQRINGIKENFLKNKTVSSFSVPEIIHEYFATNGEEFRLKKYSITFCLMW